jgi:hypothetical protein
MRSSANSFLRDDHKNAVALFNQPFLYLDDLAIELRVTAKVLRDYVAMQPETGRPNPETSLFPNAYKETPALTGKICVPRQDIENYKIALVGGAPDRPALVAKIRELNENGKVEA